MALSRSGRKTRRRLATKRCRSSAGALIALNAGRQLFSDVKVRRAVEHAINRAALASIWSETPSASLLYPGSEDIGPFPGWRSPEATSPA